MWLIPSILIGLITTIRPLLSHKGCCRYAYSCTDYGIYQLQTQSTLQAIKNISKRLATCHPFWW